MAIVTVLTNHTHAGASERDAAMGRGDSPVCRVPGKGSGEVRWDYDGNGYLPGLVVGRFELYFDFNLKHTNRSFCRCLMPDEQLRRRRRQ